MVNPQFHKETDIEVILCYCIDGSCFFPRKPDVGLANIIAEVAEKLKLVSEETDMPELEAAMNWVASVAMTAKRAATA